MARGIKKTKEKRMHAITEDGLKLLQKEYDDRTNVLRDEIATKIDEARRYGDLSENNAYTSALEEKDFNEARILELEQLIQTSTVVKDNHTGKVSLGTTVYLKSTKGVVTYKIVGAEESDPEKSLISDQSPLGKSLLGKQEGDRVNVRIPSGNMEFTIEKID